MNDARTGWSWHTEDGLPYHDDGTPAFDVVIPQQTEKGLTVSADTPSEAERLRAERCSECSYACTAGFIKLCTLAHVESDVARLTAENAALLREHEAMREDAHIVAAFVDGWWPGLEDGISWGDDTDLHPAYLAAQRITAARSTTEAATRRCEVPFCEHWPDCPNPFLGDESTTEAAP